ncbi:MAG: hypothetical protein PGN23_17265 [Sphingomonas adhaesiva]|uniref:hypothetical protein n=1 Tax=Sphingomonas adhaesiva TaxID=28212 RepID=UPI002FF515A4
MTDGADLWLLAKDVAVATSGLSRPALHVLLGTALFALLLPASPIRAWAIVIAIELANEAVDRHHLLAIGAGFDPMASWRDVVDTMMLPTLILLARQAWHDGRHGYRRRRRRARRGDHQPANTALTASRRT